MTFLCVFDVRDVFVLNVVCFFCLGVLWFGREWSGRGMLLFLSHV